MFSDSNPPTNPPAPAAESTPNSADPHESAPKPAQELTLSYLRDPPKPHSQELPDPNLSISKGKEIAPESPDHEAPRWVERDFLHLSTHPAPKREPPEPLDHEFKDKKPRVETLNLSLAPPDLSLLLDQPTAAADANAKNPMVPPRKSFSHNNVTRMTNSEDYSYSHSVPFSQFSHNPSCSLTRNSTENCESDQFWYCGGGEGTNGSVHSRFRLVGGGDGNTISFMGHNGVKDLSNGVCRGNAGSEGHSFFPSELPARPARANGNGNVSADCGRNAVVARPDRVLREIVSESVSVVAQMLQELPSESLEAVKDCLRSMMDAPERREALAGLRRRLDRRSDLTMETLMKCHRAQLDILVAIKTGIVDFLSAKNRLSNVELVEVFLLTKCRNMNCKSVLPVDDCDCKICSTKKGFCSACMCPVCFNFDCASNTCSWVGCDVCSHWCHAVCGIEKSLIRPGPSLKGALGTTEMQFHCLGCGHASEMFGFVKEVFTCCAKEWGLETLTKELDCVRKIFQGSEDFEGKALQGKAEEMLTMLSKKLVSPADACNAMLSFFKYGVADHSVTGSSSKSVLTAQASQKGHALHPPSTATILPPKPTFNLNSNSSLLDIQINAAKTDPKFFASGPHFSLPKKEEVGGGLQSLESIMKFKEEEAKLFQRLADDARREVESYRQIVRAKSEKLEEEYASKLARLCLQETEERRRRKAEELKNLENSQCDYHNMKMRMQTEIANLLQTMEATKKQWV